MLSKRKRAQVRRKTGNYCWYCGVSLANGKMTVDHVVPRSKGGAKKHLSNLIPSCQECNEEKGSMSLEEYRQSLDRKTFYGERAGWKI